ncbi:MAG: hypothetical protein ACOX21_00030 [Bacillota bacterium]
MRKTFGLAYAQTLIGLRNLYPLISVGLIPGALYLMFFLVGGQELSQHVLYGALIAQALGAGLVSMPQFIVIHRDRRLLDMYIASPMGPLSYMFGFAGGRLIYMLPGMVILFSILLGFGFMQLHNLPRHSADSFSHLCPGKHDRFHNRHLYQEPLCDRSCL